MHQNKGLASIRFLPDLGFAVLLGLAFMELVMGLDKINPAFTSWILIRGSDIAYHYLSWEYFKDTPWTWPPGKLEGYAYPMYNSVLYTDSIPLFAFLFKLLRYFLPNDFQYFGLWFALCFILNTFLGIELLKQIGWTRGFRWLLAPFFSGAVVFIARFGHAALCGQWVLLYTLLIYLNRDNWKPRALWAHLYLVVFLSSLIHPYLLFMVLGLSCAVPMRLKWDYKITWSAFWIHILAFTVISFIGWYLSGAFLFKGQLSEGLGKFSANLNTFFNAWDVGRLGPNFQYYGDGQGEGIAYLGLGMLFILLLLTGSFLVQKWITNHQSPTTNHLKPVRSFQLRPINTFLLISLLFFLFALSPKWTLGQHLLIDWGYNDYISRTFRGTGRFTWPLFYFILYSVFLRLYQWNISLGLKYILVVSALFLQAADLSPLWKRKPYVDDPPFRMAFIDQIQYLISTSEKVIIYPPYVSTIADFGDYIYFTDLAQREKKPITTGYGARFPEAIGRAFRDSINHISAYLNSHLYDLLITHVDSVSLHQRLIQDVKGVSFQFDRYRLFISDSLKSKIDLGGFDPKSMEAIRTCYQVQLIEYLRMHQNQIILGAVYEEGVSNLRPATKEYLKRIGLSADSLRFGTSWVFILKGQKATKESISVNERAAINDTLECGNLKIPIHIESGGYQAGKTASIVLNHEEQLQPGRGLSLVVLDSCGVVQDKVRFDTYLSDGYLER